MIKKLKEEYKNINQNVKRNYLQMGFIARLRVMIAIFRAGVERGEQVADRKETVDLSDIPKEAMKTFEEQIQKNSSKKM